MKKKYVIPECVVYTVTARPMCLSETKSASGTFSDASDGFFSKGYAGGVEDDSSADLWKEEEK